MADKPLPDRQQSYLDTILARLRSNEFELTQSKAAATGLQFAAPPTYLWVGKHLKYSPLSVIGFIEEAVFIGYSARVNFDSLATFARQALADALVTRTRFKWIFPVLVVRVFPVLLTDEGATGLSEHFRETAAPLDMSNKSLVCPVVFDAATKTIDYYRKVPIFGGMEVQAGKSTVERLFTP